jgi:hypothetical protein
MAQDLAGRLRRCSNVEARQLAEGSVIVDMRTGQCYRLNRVGAEIWSLLDRPLAIPEICASIADRYQRSLTAIEPEITAMIEHLAREKLVEPVE